MDVALINGLFVRMAGPPAGRTLVLLHVFADSGLAFTPLFATPLADRFRLVAPDLAGFGASPPRHNVRTSAHAYHCQLCPPDRVPIHLVHHEGSSAERARQVAGATPNSRLNARLNAASES